MVRDSEAAQDGWFWGWFGWTGWAPDWPPGPRNTVPNMGFGQACLNCHGSAKDNSTFASLRNIQGEAGRPLVFLSQNFFEATPELGHHRLEVLATDDPPRLGEPFHTYTPAFTDTYGKALAAWPDWQDVIRLPSETYDNVWVPAGHPGPDSAFVTSDQCIGCHDAGSTGLQYDMTEPDPHGDKLLNRSPYGTWRGSPMGLAGRDPVFLAQLASETQRFHPEKSPEIQDVCLGCHGVAGQRQHAIDGFAASGRCEPFLRADIDAVPWPAGAPGAADARFGALARDGITCTACHRMELGSAAASTFGAAPQNACVDARQAFLNPGSEGFARTFTGSFLIGAPDQLGGPFADPKVKPMLATLGNRPVHAPLVKQSELCGTCHTVHLPILQGGQVVGHTYEQTTYPEWAFSDYRTGTGPDGPLPQGAGTRAQSCQDCHMPSRDKDGHPFRSKIASIQEFSNFPEADNNLGPEDIDLPVRDGFARHTLVGLNLFFTKMAQQFPDLLGIRTQDPMLVGSGVDPLLGTERAMLEQAAERTADIALGDVGVADGTLHAKVSVTSRIGHKFPSGVGFRRAFIELAALDATGAVVWGSGRTDASGRIVDGSGRPVPGEVWWKDDCSARLNPGNSPYQPHFQRITSESEAQIYQELVTSPAAGAAPQCGTGATQGGDLTTSFLSICGEVKDNRILPHGFLGEAERISIAEALGAGHDLAEEVAPKNVGDDPDYVTGGGDSLVYEIPLAGLARPPVALRATLYYQAMPPAFLQDRFCTSKSEDTRRLYFMAGHLNLAGTPAEGWKLEVADTGPVALP
jgi:hypothetical protein